MVEKSNNYSWLEISILQDWYFMRWNVVEIGKICVSENVTGSKIISASCSA